MSLKAEVSNLKLKEGDTDLKESLISVQVQDEIEDSTSAASAGGALLETSTDSELIPESVQTTESESEGKSESEARPAKKLKEVERPRPIDKSRPFEFHELFFSVTDPKSAITFSNNVFTRLSGYPAEVLSGQLHKLIRHPDMPRAVFKVFWDFLKAGKPVAAYVKNMSADGSYYWVMALAMPCNGGYLSVRLKPGSELFQKVRRLYSKTLELEKKEEKSTNARKAMEKAENFLFDSLKEEGYESYESFMWTALQEEMYHREEKITSSGHVDQIHQLNIPVRQKKLQILLGELFEQLEKLEKLHDVLMDQAEHMLELARSILLLSLNAQISSAKLDQTDQSLNVAAENMGSQSIDGEKKLMEIQQLVTYLNQLLRKLSFNIIASKLQVEMINLFMHDSSETSESDGIEHQRSSPFQLKDEEVVEMLLDAVSPHLNLVAESLSELPENLRKLKNGVNGIENFLDVLRFIHIIGKVEIARMNDQESSFSNTFQELVLEVNNAQEKLDELTEFLLMNEQMSQQLAAHDYELRSIIQWMEQ